MIESLQKRLHREPETNWLAIGLAVVGIAGLTYLAVKRTARKRQHTPTQPSLAGTAESSRSSGERTVFRIITVKAHPANVESDWNEYVSSQGSDESRDATVTFAPAPGARGTEIRAELAWAPKAGKIGETVQRMRHKSPGQMLGRDLKQFKMLCETGEVINSDASVHKHMHPAQPSAEKQIPRFAQDDNTQEEAR